jgi:two-component system, OmpR family, response regulator
MHTVLVIDGDATLRYLMVKMLQRLMCHCLTASTSSEGETLALEVHPALVLLDMMVPGQGGYITCQNLRAKGYTGVITLVSVLPELDGAQRQACGADAYLRKPITIPILKNHLQWLSNS